MEATKLSPASKRTLILHFPDGEVRHVVVEKALTTIGRLAANDIVIDHPTVSRKHARLALVKGELFIEDLGAANPTMLDGKPLTPHEPVELTPATQLQIGSIEIRVEKAPQAVAEAQTILHPPAGVEQVKAVYVQMPSGAIPAGVSPRSVTPAGVTTPSSPFSQLGEQVSLLYRRLQSHGTVVTVLALGGMSILGLFAILLLISALSGIPLLSMVTLKGSEHVCIEKPMKLVSKGGDIYQAAGIAGSDQATFEGAAGGSLLAPTLAEGETPDQTTSPILSLAFLEMPFPYDGGNDNFGGTDEQFRLAMRLNDGKLGRINSFFDHLLPLYPYSNDPNLPGGQEQPEPPIGDNILMFTGALDPVLYYSGHPGYDFSTYVPRQATTPVFAAADGEIYLVGEHSSGALFVKIKHTIVGVGDFLTVYWHLHPDEFFEAMRGREGQPIRAGARIGTMGNTGFSTGHHLHFEVRFDANNDGNFSLSEVVDPSGWIPTMEYPIDPWFERSGNYSYYLWKHPLGVVGIVPWDGAGSLEQAGLEDSGGRGGEGDAQVSDKGTMCARSGTLPPGGMVFWSWTPNQPPMDGRVAVGNGCVLSVLDEQGNPVSEFKHPLNVTVPFSEQELLDIDPKTLTIYWQESGSVTWKRLKTSVDMEGKVALAETDRPGKCVLMGEPTRDIVPPKSQILLDGKTSRDGQFYDTVTVTLNSEDPSGIERIEYSLDGGDNWLVYQKPFVVEPGEAPQIVLREVEVWGGLPGVNLVLVSATDKAGNVEMPPTHMVFSINPEKNPLFVNPAGADACSVPSHIILDATCRSAPGADSINIATYASGTNAILVARNLESTWFMISRPDLPRGACWVSRQFIETSNEVSCLSVVGVISDAPPQDETMTALNIPVTGPTSTPPPIPNLTPSPTPPPLRVSPSPTPPPIRGSRTPTPPSFRGTPTATPPALRLSPTATPPRLFISPTATAPDLGIDPTNTPPPPANPPTATPPPP